MISLEWCKREVTANKKRTGALIGDTSHELCLIGDELKEAVEAFEENLDNLGEELADIILFVCAVADNEDIDLEKEIKDKIEKNKHRVWT